MHAALYRRAYEAMLRQHLQAGLLVATGKDGKVVWVAPDKSSYAFRGKPRHSHRQRRSLRRSLCVEGLSIYFSGE